MTQPGHGGWPAGPPPGTPPQPPYQPTGLPGGQPVAPPPGWQGTYPNASPGRDPRASFGQPPPAPVNIDSFAPPKASGSTMVTIVAAIVLALVVMGGLFFRSTLTPTPTPTPSARTSAPAGAGQPFTTPDGLSGGRWQILESRWVDGGVSILVRISIDDGPVSYSFRAFPNAGSDVLESGDGPDRPVLDRGTITGGRSAEGWVFFATERGDVTVILSTGAGRQMSALVVKG